jgi:hypothetical protein
VKENTNPGNVHSCVRRSKQESKQKGTFSVLGGKKGRLILSALGTRQTGQGRETIGLGGLASGVTLCDAQAVSLAAFVLSPLSRIGQLNASPNHVAKNPARQPACECRLLSGAPVLQITFQKHVYTLFHGIL